MSLLIDALQTKDVRTENGMPAHSETGSKVLDLFSKSGAMRKGGDSQIRNLFSAAFGEDPLLALRALFYSRDIRGGQGERRFFRLNLRWLGEHFPQILIKNLPAVIKYGRWDDLMELQGTEVQDAAIRLWARAISDGDGLASKWAPRSGPWFAFLRNALYMKQGNFRRLIARQSQTVEQLMCKNEWPAINYSHVPSVANLRYRKAFYKRDKSRYEQFIEEAKKGTKKINAGTLYPSDLVAKYFVYDPQLDNTVEALWTQLPNWLENNEGGILPICDVSGSMSGEPMNVSVALGLYLSERMKGSFKDVVVTFSESPAFHKISGATLRDRVNMLHRAPWGMSTDFTKVFRILLDRALKNGVDASEMPRKVLVISDMQFNECSSYPSLTALESLRAQYRASGYEMPEVVFWNVRASKGQPAKKNDKGVQLVSGYSPSIMKSILAGKPQETPYELMVRTLEKYDDIIL